MADRLVADFIVVGAGSAGSIVAARLASAGADVVLIEAGGTDHRPDVRVPTGIASLYMTANWKHQCAPDPSKGDITEHFPGGRIIGGSGSINAMVYVRGRAADYDGWSEGGCPGWSFDQVLPHFKAIEDWVGGGDEYRGDAARFRCRGVDTTTRLTRRSSLPPPRPGMTSTRTRTAGHNWACAEPRSTSVEGCGFPRHVGSSDRCPEIDGRGCWPGRRCRGSSSRTVELSVSSVVAANFLLAKRLS